MVLQDQYVSEQREAKELGPSMMNAFELITLSQGLNLSALFETQQVWYLKHFLCLLLAYSMLFQDI